MPWADGDRLTPTNLNTTIPSFLSASAGVYYAAGYGALGDGSADDITALQALASSLSTTGGILQLSAGTYLVSAPLVVPAGVIVRGVGQGRTVLQRKASTVTNGSPNNRGAVLMWGPSSNATYGTTSRGSYGVVEDLTIDGGDQSGLTNTNTAPHGLRADFLDYLQCHRVTFQNCYGSGAYLWAIRRSNFDTCSAISNGRFTVAASRNGIAITGPQDAATSQGSQDGHAVVNCNLIQNEDEGVSFGRVGEAIVRGCIIRDNGDSGVEGDSGTAASDTANVPAGIIVEGCYIHNHVNAGVALLNSNVQRYIVAHNSITSSGGAAITSTSSDLGRIVIQGNSIQSFGALNANAHGITISGDMRDVLVSDNVIDGGYTYGVVLVASAATKRINIGGNIIRSLVSGGGMSLTGAFTGGIRNNFVEGCQGDAGITISGGASGSVQNVVLSDNLVLNSGKVGGNQAGYRVRTNGASLVSGVQFFNCVATDNQATKTQSYGLLLAESTASISNLRVTGCDFNGNATGLVNGLQSWMTTSSALTSF